MTRRSLIRVLLSLLLLLSQQMAISHAMTHLTGSLVAAQATPGADRDFALSKAFAQDQTCDQCLAFAQIAGTLGTTPRWFAADAVGSSAVTLAATQPGCARTVCVFQSRAPPAAS